LYQYLINEDRDDIESLHHSYVSWYTNGDELDFLWIIWQNLFSSKSLNV